MFPAIIAMGQYNIPLSLDEDYCHHLKYAEKQVKVYQNPVTVNTLLQEYDLKFCFLDIAIENNTVAISGNVALKAVSTVLTLDTFAFELIPQMTVDSVFLEGLKRNFQRNGDLVTVPLANGIDLGQLFTAKIFYHGTPPTGEFFSGVTTDYDDTYNKSVTWSLSEPYAAKEWWPTKQDLQDKIDSVWVFLTTSSGNKAGSEGLLTNITTLPNGKVRYEWKSYYPIDYYLISFAVADYMEYNIYAHPAGTNDSVLIQNYLYDDPSCFAVNQGAIDETASLIELYSDLFGLYPFINEKYGHCLTELAGGMEHQTMTTLGGFNFSLMAHELGHMWFGDKVTCATWSDIWINEGFATYADYLAHHFLAPPVYDSIWLKIRHDQVKGQPGGSVYVPADQIGDIYRIFDGRLSYSKGGLILHMLRFELQNDDLFFSILQTYVDKYGDSVATGDDFREWVELKSGRDFTDFFNQWYYGEGYPIYDIAWSQSDGYLHITSTQSSSTGITPLFKMTVPYFVKFTDGTDSTLLLFQDANLNTYSVPMPKTITSMQVDPKQWILHKLNSLHMGIEETGNPVFFTLGPNPAKDYVRIYINCFPRNNPNLRISDLTGRIVHEQKISNSKEDLTMKDIPSGVYLVTLSDGKNSLTRKLIVE